MKPRMWLCLVVLVMVAPRNARAQTGEFRANAGLMTGLGSGGAPVKPVTSASFSFVTSHFSMGPEVSWAFGEERIFGIGLVSRFHVSTRGVRPYVVGGLGGNYWKRNNYVTAGLLTGSLGAGISLAARRSVDLTLETRVHKNLQRDAGGNWDFVTLTAGVKFQW